MQIINDILKSFDNLFTSDEERLEAEKKLFSLFTEHDKGSMEINKLEAAGNFLQRGWRPLLAYVCVFAFAYANLLVPIFHLTPIAVEGLTQMLYYLLGYGGLRTIEKIKGATK